MTRFQCITVPDDCCILHQIKIHQNAANTEHTVQGGVKMRLRPWILVSYQAVRKTILSKRLKDPVSSRRIANCGWFAVIKRWWLIITVYIRCTGMHALWIRVFVEWKFFRTNVVRMWYMQCELWAVLSQIFLPGKVGPRADIKSSLKPDISWKVWGWFDTCPESSFPLLVHQLARVIYKSTSQQYRTAWKLRSIIAHFCLPLIWRD